MIRLVRCMRGLLRKFQLWQMAESVRPHIHYLETKTWCAVVRWNALHTCGCCVRLIIASGNRAVIKKRNLSVKSVDAVDDLTVKLLKMMPNPYGPFVGSQTRSCKGAVSELYRNQAAECTAENFGPIGTGTVTDKPNDVIQMKANENYREAGKPRFATLFSKVVETLPVPVGPSWKRGNMIMRGPSAAPK